MLVVLLVEFVVDLEAVRFVVIDLCEGCVVFVCFFFVAAVLIVFLALVVKIRGGGGL